MPSRRRQAARPLFVVSNDFGELGLAMFFLQGQECSTRAAIALPDRLYANHREIVPGHTHHYSSVRDILELVDEHRANVVLLFSGYLLSNNRLLSRAALCDLVRKLRDRGCVVLTSDPFLGLASRLTEEQVRLDVPLKFWVRLLLRRHERRFVKDLSSVSDVLQPVIHLYHRVPAEWTSRQLPRSVTFFNPRASELAPEPVEKRWLFVIGAEDANWGAFSDGAMTRAGDVWLEQRRYSGADENATRARRRAEPFATVVARMLKQASAAGRRPTLIAPAALINCLPREIGETCDLVPFCPFPEFLRYVLQAEYAFYWNAISASILPRLALQLPVFFFDRGHMSRLIKPLYDLGVELHYGGTEPTYLDPAEPLDSASLARTWAAHGLGNRRVLEEWRAASPSPQDLMDRLLDECRPSEIQPSVEDAADAQRAVETPSPGDHEAATGAMLLTETFERDVAQGLRELQVGCWWKAIGALQRACAARPEEPEPHRLLGQAAAGNADWELAARCFARTLELDAATFDVMVGLGDALASTQRFDSARQVYVSALELEPRSAKTCVKLGSVLERMGRLDEAIGQCARATELDPDCLPAYLDMGRMLCASGRPEAALSCTARAIELGGATPLLYLRLARAHAGAGNVELAAAAYQDAAALVPQWSQLQRLVGDLSAARGRWEEAAALYLGSVRNHSDNQNAAVGDYAGEPAPPGILELVSEPRRIPAYVELARLLDAQARQAEAQLVRSRVSKLRLDASKSDVERGQAGELTARILGARPRGLVQAPPERPAIHDEALDCLVERQIVLLDLGNYESGSLSMWHDYFKSGTIIGLDVSPVLLNDRTGRIRIFAGYQEELPLLDRIVREVAPEGFDVIADDASYRGEMSQRTFEPLFSRYLRAGGVYVITGWQSGAAGFVKKLLDGVDAFARVVVAGDRVFVFKKADAGAARASIPRVVSSGGG